MFKPRYIESQSSWSDSDGIKIYTISVRDESVDQSKFMSRFKEVKQNRKVDWSETPSFVIFHEGSSALYLVLAWWGNDNELFTSVSAKTTAGWVEDSERFSFCIWDLEVIWNERSYFLEHIYTENPDLESYRGKRFVNTSRD